MKPWSASEIERLEDGWGTFSVGTLSRNIGRSENAVRLKAYKLGLGPHLENGEYVSGNALIRAIYGESNGQYALRRWIRAGLPVHRQKVIRNSFMVIRLEEFWRWAESHKGMLDTTRFEINALGKEPDWMKVKRRADVEGRFRKAPWTAQEDGVLRSMAEQRCYTYEHMGAVLHRSQAAIKRRIYDLHLPGPVRKASKAWTETEEGMALQMIFNGDSYDLVAKKLERTAGAVRARIELLEKRARKEVIACSNAATK